MFELNDLHPEHEKLLMKMKISETLLKNVVYSLLLVFDVPLFLDTCFPVCTDHHYYLYCLPCCSLCGTFSTRYGCSFCVSAVQLNSDVFEWLAQNYPSFSARIEW